MQEHLHIGFSQLILETDVMAYHHKLTKLVLGAVALAASAQASAALIDPSTLHIGPGFGTPCATGGCPLSGGEVNAIGATKLDIYQNSGGALTLHNPFYLILGVPNDTAGGTALSGSTVGPGTLYPGATAVTVGSGVFKGLMTAGQEAYTVAGFLGANNSNSFTNWSAWDANSAVLTSPITATNFGIYTFTLQTGSFAANDTLDVTLNNIPKGTFAIAYGIHGNKAYSTPFTEAGLETTSSSSSSTSSSSSSSTSGGGSSGGAVPEPATLALMGLGLVGLAITRRRSIL